MILRDPFIQGLAGYVGGTSRLDCPHPESSNEHAQWLEGWDYCLRLSGCDGLSAGNIGSAAIVAVDKNLPNKRGADTTILPDGLPRLQMYRSALETAQATT